MLSGKRDQTKTSGLRKWFSDGKRATTTEQTHAPPTAPKPQRTYTPRYAARDMALSLPSQRRAEQVKQQNFENVCSEIGFGHSRAPSMASNLKRVSVHSNVDLLHRPSNHNDSQGQPSSLWNEPSAHQTPRRPPFRYSYSSAAGLPGSSSSSSSHQKRPSANLTTTSELSTSHCSESLTQPGAIAANVSRHPAHHRASSYAALSSGFSTNDFAYRHRLQETGDELTAPRRQAYFSHTSIPSLRHSRTVVNASTVYEQNAPGLVDNGAEGSNDASNGQFPKERAYTDEKDLNVTSNSSSNASFVGSCDSEASTRTLSTAPTIVTENSESTEPRRISCESNRLPQKPPIVALTTY